MTAASPNFNERRGAAKPSLIVLHYTAIAMDEARARLCDPLAEVSAHYLISAQGPVEQLVDEGARAWHAGAGEWAGVTDVNSHSIGVELENLGDHPFAAPQMRALETLLAGIMARWSIPRHRVIGHSDMAPTRKADPGARFDWRRLAVAGLSVWPDAVQGDVAHFRSHLRRFGYGDWDDATLLRAFRLRFRPWVFGPLDAVDAGMAADLAARFPVDGAGGAA